MDTESIYMVYAKALDKVDHQLLLLKLEKYIFHPKLITIIKSFISDRFQGLVLNGKKANPAKIASGVPQGVVIGPVLFIIFIDYLEKRIKTSNISIFADDIRVSKKISQQTDCVELQDHLNSINQWSREKNMKFHQAKFELTSNRANPKLLMHDRLISMETHS